MGLWRPAGMGSKGPMAVKGLMKNVQHINCEQSLVVYYVKYNVSKLACLTNVMLHEKTRLKTPAAILRYSEDNEKISKVWNFRF